MSFVYALLTTLLWVVLPGVLSAVTARSRERLDGFIVMGVLAVVFLGVNWLVIFLALPAVGFGMTVFWFSMWWMALEALITAGIVTACTYKEGGYKERDSISWSGFIVALVAVVLLLIPLFGGIWTGGRAKKLATEISGHGGLQSPAGNERRHQHHSERCAWQYQHAVPAR